MHSCPGGYLPPKPAPCLFGFRDLKKTAHLAVPESYHDGLREKRLPSSAGIIPGMPEELFICVDVETAGPIPGQYAMLSIGACLVDDPSTTFYVELQPDREDFSPEAMRIHGLSLDSLKQTGLPPKEAMEQFSSWVKKVSLLDRKAVFVALNAPFDWMFVNDYFHRYLGENPFGHSALDIKAYFMGQMGVNWAETSLKHISEHLLEQHSLDHNALSDALEQAEVFRKILAQSPKFNRAE